MEWHWSASRACLWHGERRTPHHLPRASPPHHPMCSRARAQPTKVILVGQGIEVQRVQHLHRGWASMQVHSCSRSRGEGARHAHGARRGPTASGAAGMSAAAPAPTQRPPRLCLCFKHPHAPPIIPGTPTTAAEMASGGAKRPTSSVGRRNCSYASLSVGQGAAAAVRVVMHLGAHPGRDCACWSRDVCMSGRCGGCEGWPGTQRGGGVGRGTSRHAHHRPPCHLEHA